MNVATQLRQALARDIDTYGEIQALLTFTAATDRELSTLFQQHAGTGVALVAVGGYGRGTLHPYSDVDIMLLLADDFSDTEQLSALIADCWDLGFEIGSSVRNTAQCIEAAADLTVMTALFERRLITGDAQIFEQLDIALNTRPPWSKKEYVAAKIAELNARHSNNDEGSKRVEPNIKTAPGALRDLHTLRWLGEAVHGSGSFAHWVKIGFITDEEHQSLLQADQYLSRLRTQLHLLSQRRMDKLSFSAQQELARNMGYQGDHNSAVEQFMFEGYYRYAAEIERLSHQIIQQFRESFDQKTTPAIELGPRFELRGETLHLRNPSIFSDYPPALMEVYVVAASDPRVKYLATETVREIGKNLHLIDEQFRQDMHSRQLFVELLQQNAGVTHQLKRMHRHGVLRRYWPEFGRISGLMQFDMFHIYCVDEHTLWVMRYLQRMRFTRYSNDYPIATAIAKRVDSTLLFFMGLCHDVAKGRSGDHCIEGAPIAYEFCILHGLSEKEATLVAWVVLHHLDLSDTAQKRDIGDPEIIGDFAELVGDQDRLDYLFLLTIADIQGTQPALWNNWRASLIHDLYRRTSNYINNDRNGEAIVNRRRQRIRARLSERLPSPIVEQLILSIGEYGLRAHSSAETAWQLEQIAEHDFGPFFQLVNFDDQGSTTLVIHTPDQKFMLARVFAELARRRLEVLSASIQTTTAGYALDRIRIVDHLGEPIESLEQRRAIANWVEEALAREYEPTRGRISAQPNPLRVKTEVSFDDDIGEYTWMVVIAKTQPGLLAAITAALARCEVDVHRANITTFGERAEDSFVISSGTQKHPVPSAKRRTITQSIIKAIDELQHE